jgi:hypothetical protein
LLVLFTDSYAASKQQQSVLLLLSVAFSKLDLSQIIQESVKTRAKPIRWFSVCGAWQMVDKSRYEGQIFFDQPLYGNLMSTATSQIDDYL